MDEQEKADRMAAAEALYMMTRADKPGLETRSSKRERKKKVPNYDFVENNAMDSSEDNNTSRRGRGKTKGRGNSHNNNLKNGAGVTRGGRGDRAGGPKATTTNKTKSSSPRGRKKKNLEFREEESQDQTNSEDEARRKVLPEYSKDDEATTGGKRAKKSKKQKLHKDNSGMQNQSSSSSPSSHSRTPKQEDLMPTNLAIPQAYGFTGAALSFNASQKSESPQTQQNLPSLGLVSALKQVSLMSTSESTPGLPSVNLPSMSGDVANLPSLPLGIGDLQLSSKPTPNLSSFGEPFEGTAEDEGSDRDKSEKFLPLKKRKLINAEGTEAKGQDTSLSSFVGSERITTPFSQGENVKFTVQAPPIITMQTLMEIKTALTADDDGDLPLHIAVVHENMRMVTKLINLMKIAGKGVDKFNKQQQTPLHLAVKLNFLDAVNVLLTSGANVNAVDCTGSSALHMAVQGGFTECLRILLDRCPDADLNTRNFDGLSPLHTAVDNGDLGQAKMLLDAGADIDMADGKSGRTALFRAAETNQKAVVEMLLKKGANPDVPNYAGVTTGMAAQGRNLHGVLKLITSVTRVDVDMKQVLTTQTRPPLYIGFSSSNQPAPSVLQSGKDWTQPSSTVVKEVVRESQFPASASISKSSSDQTKVYHNVFLVSQPSKGYKSSKSASVPASPEVKMEVGEAGSGGGLSSLPEGIFEAPLKAQEPLLKSPHVLTPGSPSGLKIIGPGDAGEKYIRSEQSSLGQALTEPPKVLEVMPGGKGMTMVRIVSGSTTGSVLKMPKAPPVQVVADAAVVAQPKSPPVNGNTGKSGGGEGSDTVTLTGMQARLYQRLLDMYNVEMTNASKLNPQTSSLNVSSPSVPSTSGTQQSPIIVQRSSFDSSTSSARVPRQDGTDLTRFRQSEEKSPLLVSLLPPASSERVEVQPPIPSSPPMPLNLSSRQGSDSEREVVSLNSSGSQLLPVSNVQLAISSAPSTVTLGERTRFITFNVKKPPVRSPPLAPKPQNEADPVSALKGGKPGTKIPNFPHITKAVSEKTAAMVREFLVRQNFMQGHQATTTSTSQVGAYHPIVTVANSGKDGQQELLDLRMHDASSDITTSVPGKSSCAVSSASPSLRSSFSSDARVVGFSGAILSVPTSGPGRNSPLVEEFKPTVPKESSEKQPGKKRGRKPKKTQPETVPLVEPSAEKINYVTDMRLKKFLGARKGDLAEKEGRKKVGIEIPASHQGDCHSSSPGTPISVGQSGESAPTLKTVGIFSGDVQFVQMHKTHSTAHLGPHVERDLSEIPLSPVKVPVVPNTLPPKTSTVSIFSSSSAADSVNSPVKTSPVERDVDKMTLEYQATSEKCSSEQTSENNNQAKAANEGTVDQEAPSCPSGLKQANDFVVYYSDLSTEQGEGRSKSKSGSCGGQASVEVSKGDRKVVVIEDESDLSETETPMVIDEREEERNGENLS